MSKGESGEYTEKLKGWMKDIMYGNEQHEWGVIVPENDQLIVRPKVWAFSFSPASTFATMFMKLWLGMKSRIWRLEP